jgi:2-C-methyl-D-erythritol 2,4-cyclodiphosphate synthase
MRIGHGVDVHRFGGQGPVVLCGVIVDDDRGIEATSDGDVAAHALTDALLGAAALGDIGMIAPPDEAASLGADSMSILSNALAMVTDAGYSVENVDVTIIAQTVRVAPHRDAMRRNLADALDLPPAAVSVKATTTDGLGLLGRDEGLAAIATAAISVQAE